MVTGRVLTVACQAVAGTVLDFWQADGTGNYDNRSYRLRGHQSTDGEGRYSLETVVPGEYSGRTRHIHVKVQAGGGPGLTTQLYFPGVSRNQQDSIFDPVLVMDLKDVGGSETAAFDFVLPQR
jgi:protocatechuate 3,4-dioxygenase beta subunit